MLRIAANEMTFAALSWGDPAAPLALCLHGYPDTAHTWRHLGPELAADGWHVVAPFGRGYGPTDLAPDDRYDVAALGEDALALHAALGGDDRAVLVGHDWGAVAANVVAEQAPGRFARVVTMSVPPPRALVPPPSLRQARMSWYMLFNQLPGVAERAQPRLIPALWRAWSPGYDATDDVARVFDALRGPGRRRAALRYYRGLRPSDFLRKPRQALIHLHGDQDGCMGPAVVRERAFPPGSRTEILPGLGHFLHLEDPRRVNGMIRRAVGAPR